MREQGDTSCSLVYYFFRFFNGFFTPLLTRYTEAASMAPSAKLANGVETSAKIIGIP